VQCIDTTGFDPDVPMSKVTYEVRPADQKQTSITAYCFRHPNETVCVNFGGGDALYTRRLNPELPPPNLKYEERIVVGDAFNRRRLAVPVPAVKAGQEPLGVIRVTRSSKERPFTEDDQRMLKGIADSPVCCRSLFVDLAFKSAPELVEPGEVAPNIYSPPTTLLENELQKCINALAPRLAAAKTTQAKEEQGPSRGIAELISQGCVFVHWKDSRPHYQPFAFQPRHQFRTDDNLPGFSGELRDKKYPYHEEIAVFPCHLRGGGRGSRVCVPLLAWDEADLVDALFTLDFAGDLSWSEDARWHLIRASIGLAGLLSRNFWQPDPDLLKKDHDSILRGYQEYIEDPGSGTDVQRASLHLLPGMEKTAALPDLMKCPDPELRAYGVQLTTDCGKCLVPLRLGPFPVGMLLCELREDLAVKLNGVLSERRYFRALRREGALMPARSQDEEGVFRRLRQSVSLSTGAWARIVAKNLSLSFWEVRFRGDEPRDEAIVWRTEIRRQH
jgi:hypothetical protein